MKIFKLLPLYLFCFYILVSSVFASKVEVLILMPHNYGANTYLDNDNFEQFGWNVTTAGVTRNVQPCTAYAGPLGCPTVKVDYLVSEITDITKFDCLVIMHATRWSATLPYTDVINSQAAIALVKTAVDSGVVVAAFCSGVRVLAAADVLDGKTITGHPQFQSEYIAAGANYLGTNLPPVIDGNIVTCVRGQSYNIKNCEAIATAIEDTRGKQAFPPGLSISGNIDTNNYHAAEKSIIWSKTYGGEDSEGGRCVCVSNDGSFVIAGYTRSFGAGNANILLMKTDSQGNSLWEKTFGGTGREFSYSVIQTSDNGYLITGYTTSFGAGAKDLYLIKTDSDGNEIWAKTYGGAALDVGRSVIETSDGYFLICGFTESFGAGQDDVYLIKTDSDGNEIWTKTFGGTNLDVGYSVKETRDGRYIIAGSSMSYSAGLADIWLIKTDTGGNQLWARNFGESTSYEWGNSVIELQDGSFLISGNSDILYNELLDVHLLKTDSRGSEIWTKKIGENTLHEYGHSAIETENGDLIICGTTKSSANVNDIYLIRTDLNGNIQWKKTIGQVDADWGSSICTSQDGSFVITGHTNSSGAGKYDALLMKISNLQPKFSADILTGHAPLEINFTDESQGNITGWHWDFDSDGIIDATDKNPVWTYEQPGEYSVTLIISTSSESDTLIYENFIKVFNGESALKFTDKNSIVTCPASPSLNLAENLTIETWINPSDWGSNPMLGFGRILDKQKISLYLIKSSPAFNDHCLAMQTFYENGASSISMSPDNSIILNEWQHVAVTYRAGGSEMKMYINGVEQTITHTTPPSGLIADNSNFDLLLGNNQSKVFAFQGTIDELRIWSNAHSVERIVAGMNRQYIENKSGMIVCWGMNEGSGETIADKSDYGNEGTLSTVEWRQGKSLVQTSIRKTESKIKPNQFTLYANYPNPFNPETTIRYDLVQSAKVQLIVYNITGKKIKTLVSEKKNIGSHYIKWDGTDDLGRQVATGLYIYQLSTGNIKQSNKMLFLK